MNRLDFSEVNSNHTFCLLKNKIRQICQPLFKNTQIVFYNFERFYYDNSYKLLSSDSDALPEYAKCFISVMPDIDSISVNTNNKTVKEIGKLLCLSPRTVEENLI